MTKQTQTIKKFSKVNVEKKKKKKTNSLYIHKKSPTGRKCEKKIPLTIATKKVEYLEKELNTKVHMKNKHARATRQTLRRTTPESD